MTLQTRMVDSEADLAPYLDDWRRLAHTPLQSPEWLLGWWSAFQSLNTRLSVLVVERIGAENHDRQVIGIAPMFLRESWVLGRSVRFLGSGRACTDFQTLLAHPDDRTAVADQVADWLIEAQEEFQWAGVELDGVATSCPTLAHLIDRLEQHGCPKQLSHLGHTWRLDLSHGWDGFLTGLSRTQRRQVRNLVNRYDKSDSLVRKTIADCDDWKEALRLCMDLHQKRWTACGERGCFSDPRFVAFANEACGRLHERHQLEINWLEMDCRPVACQLSLVDDYDGYVYQSGRDPALDHARVGRILNLVSIRSACERGRRSIDFLRGDEIYKARLGAQPSPCVRVRLIAPQVVSRLRHSAWKVGRGIKQHAQAWCETVQGWTARP